MRLALTVTAWCNPNPAFKGTPRRFALTNECLGVNKLRQYRRELLRFDLVARLSDAR